MATRPVQGVVRPLPILGVGYRALATAISLVAIWVAATIAAVYSPDMISGSNHEHLQLSMFLAWPLAAVATGMVLLAAGIASVFVSPMVTGTDPTTIPLAAVVAPLFAVLVTAYASIYVAGAGSEG